MDVGGGNVDEIPPERTLVVIDDIVKTIDEIKLAKRGHVFGISTIAAGGALLVIIIIMITCMVWQRRRIMAVIARLKARKHRVNLNEEVDHAQAIGLLFQNGKANRRVGPFHIEEYEDDVAIRCRRGELEGFLRNFDSVKFQHELCKE